MEGKVGVRKVGQHQLLLLLGNCSRIQMGYLKDKGLELDIRLDITKQAVLKGPTFTITPLQLTTQ